jgi:hypothetical protein
MVAFREPRQAWRRFFKKVLAVDRASTQVWPTSCTDTPRHDAARDNAPFLDQLTTIVGTSPCADEPGDQAPFQCNRQLHRFLEGDYDEMIRNQYDETRQSSPAGLIIRQKEPTNLEMPFDQVDSYITPTELFYIRSHFPTPRIDVTGYRLRIDGAVRNPLALSYQELRERDVDRYFGVRG